MKAQKGRPIILLVLLVLIAGGLLFGLSQPGRQILDGMAYRLERLRRPGAGSVPTVTEAIEPKPVPKAELEQEPEPVIPARHFQDVELVYQNPELSNGCEATSLAMVLRALGYNADKVDLAYNWIPREDFVYTKNYAVCGDPRQSYPGDPASDMGFYCYPKVVVRGANAYIKAQNGAQKARDITGANEALLEEHLALGRAVMVWTTTDNGPPTPREDLAWVLSGSGGEVYVPYGNLHVVVLYGYDEEQFYLRDPLGLAETVDRGAFMENFSEVGSHAVVVY